MSRTCSMDTKSGEMRSVNSVTECQPSTPVTNFVLHYGDFITLLEKISTTGKTRRVKRGANCRQQDLCM